MSAQCYEHRFGYCTNAKTCFNLHIGAILAERRVLLVSVLIITHFDPFPTFLPILLKSKSTVNGGTTAPLFWKCEMRDRLASGASEKFFWLLPCSKFTCVGSFTSLCRFTFMGSFTCKGPFQACVALLYLYMAFHYHCTIWHLRQPPPPPGRGFGVGCAGSHFKRLLSFLKKFTALFSLISTDPQLLPSTDVVSKRFLDNR